MAKFWLCAAVGFYLLQLCSAQIGLNISCRYGGVFHVEKNHRYSLTREDAIALCKALNSTIPTWEQMKNAFSLGFETCRYGYIEDKVVVPRHTPYHLCAANNTGIYVLSSNMSDRYDTYCFNSSETRNKTCEPVIKLYSAWPNNESTIEIFNADGSRYIEGEKFTERPPVTDDEISAGSGSATDRPTTDSNFIRHGISQYPHTADVVTSMRGDHSLDQHLQHTTFADVVGILIFPVNLLRTNVQMQVFIIYHLTVIEIGFYEKQEDSAKGTPELEEDKYSSKIHPSPSISKHNHFSVLQINGASSIAYIQHISCSGIITADEVSNSGKHHENSTESQQVPGEFPLWWPSEEHERRQNTTSGKDESSEENDDDGGGDDGDDNEEGSGHINPETVIEWDNSGDQELQTSNTTVISSKDVKHEDSTHDPLLNSVHSGRYSEVNGTREDVPHGIAHLGDAGHFSTATAVSSSNDFFKQEDSNEHSLDGSQSGLETQDTVPTPTVSSDILHPGLVPSSEKESTLENESFHHTVTFFNESAEHEGSHQDQLQPVGKPGRKSEMSHAANRTILGVLKILIPPSEHDDEGTSSQTADVASNNGIKHGESTENPLSYDVHSEWTAEDPTDTSNKTMLPGSLQPPSETEHNNESVHTVVDAIDDINHEDSSNNTLIHEIHPSWSHEDKYPGNTSRDDVFLDIISPNEKKHEEDSENNHTAVLPSGDIHHEASTHETVLHKEHSEWDNEEKYLTNTSGNHLWSSIVHPTESEQEKEPSLTVTGSSDDLKPEDSTHNLVMHGLHPEIGREDKYPSNSTEHEVSLDIVFPTGHNEETIFHTVAIHNNLEDSTQPPSHQPGWETEEKYPTNTSRDDVLVGIDTDSENEHHQLYTDVVYDGSKEDTTPESVRQWVSDNKYTTKSSVDVIIPGIVPRRGINQKNRTDHTAVLATDGSKNEEPTQESSLHEVNPGQSNEGEHLLNNTQEYMIPRVFSEVDSGSDRQPSSSDSSSPGGYGRGVSHTGNVTQAPKNQKRIAHIPDWLIVVASLLALALILGVCIAVNSRRRCGQKKKLMINNGKGGIDEKNMGGLNGEASKSHEMVNLVQKEKPEDQTGPHDEFLAIDETQNQQEVALKSGV
ncbi:CD44 antigen [Sceloporus undulatus]|uniref:CD44 antigen n=1 Tax=Sceloporus undulatus TaxID=8520 RepID=UPI001C4B8505|nr:CD44 antigen [Sceloporus undulatus]